MALKRQFCRENRPADGRRRPLEDPGKQRVFERTDLVPRAGHRLDAPFGVCVLQRSDIGAIMKFEQLIRTCWSSCSEIVVRQPAEYLYQIKHGGMPDDIERMIGTECRPAKDVTADVYRR